MQRQRRTTRRLLSLQVSEQERLLKEFKCGSCKGVLREPLSTPCGHHFCRACLEKRFEGMGDVVEPQVRTAVLYMF